MKLKHEMVLTEVGDTYIVVPVGEGPAEFKGVIKLNETGKDIWLGISEGLDPIQIIEKLDEIYDDVDKEYLLRYINEITEQLEEKGLLEK